MARKAVIAKAKRLQRKASNARISGRKDKTIVRSFNVCRLCGRTRGYMGRFQMCRICFRMKARAGLIMGVKKCSW